MIESIELLNWKVFSQLQLPLKEGINFIAGPNGIGKSSILQAICAAFTGEVPDELDIKNFIRRGTDSARILLKFRRKDELLSIERNLSLRGRGRCSVLDSRGMEIFSGSWDEVTNYIEDLFNIQTFLFDRLLFMSEGDVYRTIHEPPGKQLLNEIDKLLGITQLQLLAKEVSSTRNEFQEEITRQMEILEKAKTKVKLEDLQTLEEKLSELQRIRDMKKEELDRLTRESWALKDRLRQEEMLLGDLLLLENEEKTFLEEKEKAGPLQKQLKQILIEIENVTRERLASESELANLGKITDVISETQKAERVDVKCPVCKKLISMHEINEIKNEIMAQRSLQEKKIRELLEKYNELETRKKIIEPQLDELREKEFRLRILRDKHKNEPFKIEEARKQIAEIKNKIELLKEKTEDLERFLSHNETDIGNLREKLGQVKTLERYGSLEISEISDNLKATYKGEYLCEFTFRGIEELIRRQRDSKLREKLYNSISEVWNNFKGERGWTVKLDHFALPSLQFETQSYPFHSLSAGEKTALSVVTRTMLSTLFAKDVDFLLLDEPLEHLDSRNRHSLLQFLVDACRQGVAQQMVVTTTEYSLLRKFADYEHSTIISLESLIGTRPSQIG